MYEVRHKRKNFLQKEKFVVGGVGGGVKLDRWRHSCIGLGFNIEMSTRKGYCCLVTNEDILQNT